VIGAVLMSIALTLASLAPADRAAFVQNLTPEEALVLQHTWDFWARSEQRAPAGDWSTWLVLAGRGYGKTRVGGEQVHTWAKELGKDGRIALIGKDPADIRKTMIDGESGLIACAPPWFRPQYEASLRTMTWPNGCRAFTYSAEVPDDLRGPQHHKYWGDELCKWKRPQETWDNLQFGLRLGDNPQGVVTTTPRPIPTLKEILSDPTTVTTRGSTYDNAANLPRKFLDHLKRKYEGTRLGRQELRAEVLTDTPGALWTLAMIEACRVHEAPRLVRIGIAIDPQGSAPQPGDETDDGHAETGIVAGGVDANDVPYILHDRSDQYTPGEWGKVAVELFEELKADFIVAEANNGGEMVAHVVQTAARALGKSVTVKLVHASRGKQTRAEPVSSLYEQQRAHHVGVFPELEDQMSTWVPGQKSPDRMDALVWLVTELVLNGAADTPDGTLDVGRGTKHAFNFGTRL
jgi:phage terminase large subunit-like protein